jgi:hypothetical protein
VGPRLRFLHHRHYSDPAADFHRPHLRAIADRRESIAEVHEPRLGGEFVVSCTPLFDTQGEFTGSVHVARDITERRRAEERLAADLEAMTRLQKLGTLFVHEGNLEPVLGEIVEAAKAIAAADFGSIQLLDPGTGELHISLMVGCEVRMVELKKEIDKLCRQFGQPTRYGYNKD